VLTGGEGGAGGSHFTMPSDRPAVHPVAPEHASSVSQVFAHDDLRQPPPIGEDAGMHTRLHRPGGAIGLVAATALVIGACTDAGDGPLPFEGIVIDAELGYPRDLLERGRVNLVVSRPGDEPFVVVSKQLRVSGFDPADPDVRSSSVPPNGQRMALQTEFGSVDDCDLPGPVTAAVHLTYTYGDDPRQRRAVVPISDTAVLDQVHEQECTARRVLAGNQITVEDVEVDGETIRADLVVRRTAGDEALAIEAMAGTVLVGVESPLPAGGPGRRLAAGDAELLVPVIFDVNRCDSHAVAETTRKFGFDLWISVDGAEPQRVPVTIDHLLDELETIIERCRSRTGQ
jgi:hypothetical protein